MIQKKKNVIPTNAVEKFAGLKIVLPAGANPKARKRTLAIGSEALEQKAHAKLEQLKAARAREAKDVLAETQSKIIQVVGKRTDFEVRKWDTRRPTKYYFAVSKGQLIIKVGTDRGKKRKITDAKEHVSAVRTIAQKMSLR